MNVNTAVKLYDLEDRTFRFSKEVRDFVRTLPRTISNKEDSIQLIRSSGSIGANYIEANESLGKKDFLMRIKIARKEAKESIYWLNLLNTQDQQTLNIKRVNLATEATEIMKILGSIATKSL